MKAVQSLLPPGQVERADFPRFGLLAFAHRFPSEPQAKAIAIGGCVARPITIENVTALLPRVAQVSDFHCVTTWTRRALHWSGFRFSDFYSQIVTPQSMPDVDVQFVVLRAQDGYRSILPLVDMLADDVLLADQLDGQPLSVAHGAPLRLVAPAHYGYKSVKHIQSMEFVVRSDRFRPVGLQFMAHPRARVALEERGVGVPAWLLRTVYRSVINQVSQKFAVAEAARTAT